MKRIVLIAALAAIILVSCKDSQVAQFNALGKRHLIKQYGCDGKIINEWESTGNVSNAENSDGWYFEDAKTQKLIEITGTITIEVE